MNNPNLQPNLIRKLAGAAAALALLLTPLHAADIFWAPGSAGNWSTSGNWQGGVAPVATDNVIIDSGSASIPAGLNVTTATAAIGYTASSVGAVDLVGNWNNTADLYVGAAGLGTLNVRSGGLLQLGSAKNFFIGYSGTGAVIIDQGGAVKRSGNVDLFVGGSNSSNASLTSAAAGSGTLIVNGLLDTPGSYIRVGVGGDGYLYVGQTGTINATGLRLTYNNFNSTGTVIINGVWNSSGYIIVSHYGDSYFELGRTGTAIVGEYFSVGQGDGTGNPYTYSGTALIAGNLSINTYLQVGNRLTGVLDITSTGTVKATTYLRMGSAVTGSGTINLSGILGIGTYGDIGYNGAGVINVRNGGNLSIGTYLNIGTNADTTGLLDIASGGSVTVNAAGGNAGYLRVATGSNSSGIINIAQGGALTVKASGSLNSIISIGHGSGALGIVNVDGLLSLNSTATAGDRSFAVGYGAGGDTASAVGVLNIGKTGTVTLTGANELSIGRMGVGSASSPFTTYTLSSSGTVNVAGLLNTNGAQLLIGRSGDGYLNIAKTGTVFAGNTRVSNGHTVNGISYGEANIAGYMGITGWFDIAGSGNGVVNIASTGTVITTADFTVGRSTGTASGVRNYGVLNIYGYARSNDNLVVANDGVGTLNLYDGGVAVSINETLVAMTAQSSGTLNLFGGIFVTPTVSLGAGSAAVRLNGGLLDTGKFAFGTGDATVILNGGTLRTGVLEGSSSDVINNTGNGDLILTNDSSAYAGTVNIHSGALVAAGNNVKLGGQINIGGAAALDLRDGALAATGNVTMGDGAIWQYSLSGTHVLDVAGNLAFDGGGTFYLDRDGKAIAAIPGSYTLATFATITGTENLANWQITASDFSLTAGTALDTVSVPGSLKINIGSADIDFLHWKGGDGAWDTASVNWKRNATATKWNDGALAIFSTGSGNVNVTGKHAIFGLQFDTNGYTLAGTGTLASTDSININLTAASATTTINSAFETAGLHKVGPGSLVLGGTATLAGATIVDGGLLKIVSTGALSTSDVSIAADIGTSATINVAGRLTNSGALYIGNLGSGALVIENGGTLANTGSAFLGHGAGTSGTAIVNGYWSNTGILYIGNSGVGVVEIKKGATLVTNNAINMADQLIGSGTVIVNGYLANTSGFTYVGGRGTAAFIVGQTGTYVPGSSLRVGGYDNNTGAGYGYVKIEGRLDGRVNGARTFAAGFDGQGRIDVMTTGTVINTDVYIADHATSSGTINLWGYWESNGNAYFGNSSTNSAVLNVYESGRFIFTDTTKTIYIGRNANTNGTANISGLLQTTGALIVGNSGTGVLNIKNGGRAEVTGNLTLANNIAAVGVLDIAQGASLKTAGSLVMSTTSGAVAGATVAGYMEIGGAANMIGQYGNADFVIAETGIVLVTNSNNYFLTSRYASGTGTLIVRGLLNTGTRAGGENGNFGIGWAGVSHSIISGTVITSGAGDNDVAIVLGNDAGGAGTLDLSGLLVATKGKVYNGKSGIGTLNIASTGTLLANGLYKQNQNSTLTIVTTPTRTSAYITAGSASLSGTLALTGPGLNYTPVAKSSELANVGILILTATSGGIGGNFNSVTGFGGDAPGYLMSGGIVTNQGNNVTTLHAGYRLAWDAPLGAHGTFTLAEGETFEVDTPLANRYGEVASGWDGKSLTKLGAGTLVLSGENTFTGAVTVSQGTLRLGGPATHRYGALVNNGVFDFGSAGATGNAFRTAEVASLSGNGSLRMMVNPGTGDSDRLIVNGPATGNHQLILSAPSDATAPGSGSPAPSLISIAGADSATFTGGLDYNGTNYAIARTSGGKIILATNGQSSVGDPITGVPGSQSVMWFASQDNLSRRIGELRSSGTLPNAGWSGWLRARAEQSSFDADTEMHPFDMDLYGVELGFDKTMTVKNGRVTVGIYAGYGNAKQDFDPRAGTGTAEGTSDQIGLGLYAAWLHHSGWFANMTIAAARYDNDFNSADQSGNRTNGDYNDNALGASLELGKRITIGQKGWFAEPSAQASVVRLMRDDYATTGANRLNISGADATISRLRGTVRVGRAWRQVEVAARAGASYETSSGGEVAIAGANRWRPNVDGTRAEAGLGLIWRPTAAGQLYFDYEFASGDGYEKPWSFSLGYRFAF